MKVEKVYNLLEKLKGSSSDVNVKSRRLLKYIYQDVYLNCFEKPKKDAVDVILAEGAKIGSIRHSQTIKPYEENKKQLALYLEGDESIISYFSEMINDDKKEFMDLFFQKIDTYFDIVNNNFYCDDDFKVFSFVFNIYCMLKAYHENKDNFDVYSKIVEDCSFLINCNSFRVDRLESFSTLEERKKIIDLLLSCNCYLEVEKLRNLLRDNLENVARGYMKYNAEKIESEVSLINKISYDYKLLKDEVGSDRLMSFEDAVNRCVFNEHNDCNFYSRSLLIGERLENINKKLFYGFSSVNSYREDAFSMISDLDYSFFEYLNEFEEYKENDSFIYCMDIIFDSDTYYEFNSKIVSLKEAVVRFSVGDKNAALSIVKSLQDVKHKKMIDGKVISFSNNMINQVEKSKLIFARMLKVYDDFCKEVGLNTVSVLSHVQENSNLTDFDSILSKLISDEVESIRVSRLIEEHRRELIKTEIEVMSDVLRKEKEVKNDYQALIDSVKTAYLDNDDDNLTRQDVSSDKPFQKIKSIFGKKN